MMNKSVLIGLCNLRARNLMYLHNVLVAIRILDGLRKEERKGTSRLKNRLEKGELKV